MIATAFTFAYGAFQIVYGTFGDRVGKLTVIAAAALLSSLGAFASALADGLPTLAILRLIGGCTAGAIIPLAIAHIGDVTPYDQRQAVLARFLSGQIFGIITGQASGGRWIVKSGNDGGRVRERARSVSGAVFRM